MARYFFVSGDNKAVVMPLKAMNPNFDDKYFKNIFENHKKYALKKVFVCRVLVWVFVWRVLEKACVSESTPADKCVL